MQYILDVLLKCQIEHTNVYVFEQLRAALFSIINVVVLSQDQRMDLILI